MSEWQPIETAPGTERDEFPEHWFLAAWHGRGESHVGVTCKLLPHKGNEDWESVYWADVGTHMGAPQYWMPLPTAPEGMEGPHCGCDRCNEKYASRIPSESK